jgi:tRNA pseudouridine55 synthase
MAESKVYQATLRLGIATDTLDPTGRVVRESMVPDLSSEFITSKAQQFTGNIQQTPPIFSAVKYRGKRAYQLAREGQEVTLNEKTVSIHSIRILSIKMPDVTMEVKCSGGTYIRSLASDLGRELGPGGHLRSLRRLSCGSFDLKNAPNSNEISVENISLLQKTVIPLKSALPDMREIIVENPVVENIRQGRQSDLDGLAKDLDPIDCEGAHFKLIGNGELVAVVKQTKSRRGGHVKLEIARVFS